MVAACGSGKMRVKIWGEACGRESLRWTGLSRRGESGKKNEAVVTPLLFCCLWVGGISRSDGKIRSTILALIIHLSLCRPVLAPISVTPVTFSHGCSAIGQILWPTAQRCGPRMISWRPPVRPSAEAMMHKRIPPVPLSVQASRYEIGLGDWVSTRFSKYMKQGPCVWIPAWP